MEILLKGHKIAGHSPILELNLATLSEQGDCVILQISKYVRCFQLLPFCHFVQLSDCPSICQLLHISHTFRRAHLTGKEMGSHKKTVSHYENGIMKNKLEGLPIYLIYPTKKKNA